MVRETEEDTLGRLFCLWGQGQGVRLEHYY